MAIFTPFLSFSLPIKACLLNISDPKRHIEQIMAIFGEKYMCSN